MFFPYTVGESANFDLPCHGVAAGEFINEFVLFFLLLLSPWAIRRRLERCDMRQLRKGSEQRRLSRTSNANKSDNTLHDLFLWRLIDKK